LNRVHIPGSEIGAVIGGVLDVIFAFAITLERAGLLDRSAIADTLTKVKEQTAAQKGPSSARGTVAELMLQALKLPVAGEQARTRLRVIAGDGC
jgi:hypothetical protein